jgi:hypothetical protein
VIDPVHQTIGVSVAHIAFNKILELPSVILEKDGRPLSVFTVELVLDAVISDVVVT